MLSPVHRLAALLHVDAALIAAIATRVWSGIAGLVTLALIANCLDSVEQGYYYAFWSLIALQSFVELGLLIVVVSTVSHECAHLSFDASGGLAGLPRSIARLMCLGRFVGASFSILASIFVCVAGTAGFFLLDGGPDSQVSWELPWVVAVLFSGAMLALSGVLAFLEGCNQVTAINRLRLLQGIASSMVLWTVLVSGGGLWSMAAMLATSVCIGVAYVARSYQPLIRAIFQNRQESDFSWHTDIWPMQWPLALQGGAAYFMYSLFVPVTFAYAGAEDAGRMGMGLQIGVALNGIASTWLVVRMPQMGMEFARRQMENFERLWQRASMASLATVALGAVTIVIALAVLKSTELPRMDRLPSVDEMGAILFWACLGQIMQCLAVYWRAMKRELTGPWGAVPGLVTGAAVWYGAQSYGSGGAIGGAIVVSLLLTLPLGVLYWRRARAIAVEHAKGPLK